MTADDWSPAMWTERTAARAGVQTGSGGTPGRRPNSGQRGFSLLEVLVALVVVSVGLAAITRLGVQQAQSAQVLDDLTLGGWVASNAIELARLDPAGLNVGRRQGQTTMGRQRWYWEMDVVQTEVESILRLDVAVFADPRRQQQVVSLSGFSARTRAPSPQTLPGSPAGP